MTAERKFPMTASCNMIGQVTYMQTMQELGGYAQPDDKAMIVAQIKAYIDHYGFIDSLDMLKVQSSYALLLGKRKEVAELASGRRRKAS